ncbi:MAG: endonuclease MutS2 [Christensenellales bacterium]|mgnify:FL=1
MLNKNLNRLEFNKILDELNSHCNTYIGKSKVFELEPFKNKDDVERALSETSLALQLIYRKGNPPIEEFNNIDIYIKNLYSNNFLSAKALLDVATVLKMSRTLKDYFFEDETFDLSSFSILSDYFSGLYSNLNVENKIFDSIIDENNIADNASKVLSVLRRNRKKLEQDVKDKLSNFIHSSAYSKYIMDSIITIRNDRFVIPVKEEAKDKINGSILDISASGSTVYIEPSAIYELNNKINNIKTEENIEIEKILRNLSILLFPLADNLSNDVEIIGSLDFIFAKAKYSKKINGVHPIINDTKYINLISARHPLIDPEKVVPIDIHIGDDYTSLLITGPNTGGKTATLKTTGLLSIMALCGMHIPAKEGSSIYVFDNVFADIGDEQSIQESLSTFSSHMITIIDILHQATSNSLILLDELGSGTDPVEGASLAISILEDFHNKGALTLATTHYPELKNYALVTEGFENASSDFDVEHLKPTYKLLIGVPGKSNAFAISKNLGLPEYILSNAGKYLNQEHVDIESLLKKVYDDKLEIEKEKEIIKKNSNQIELLRKSLERDNSKLNAEAESIVANAKIKAREILLNAKDETNEIIKELNDDKIDLKKANKLRLNLNDSLNSIASSPSTNKTFSFSKENISIGQTVFIKKLNQNATVLTLPNKSNQLQVQFGVITMNVKLEDLALPTNTANAQKTTHSSTSFKNSFKAKNISPEINVIGMTVDEAIPIIDKYLDDASMSGLASIRIVHGKGTGKLRSGIHQFLKSNKHTKSFRLGTFGEGEMGVTVVELR